MAVDASSREEPFPSSWSVRRARDAYLAENGFAESGYDAPWGEGSVLGVPVRVPNTARRKRAIRMHDLHHVVTGYGTDHAGEGEISAWELRRGLRPLGPYVASIVIMGALMGLFVAPRRTLAAFRAAGSQKGSLFHAADDYDALLARDVASLRRDLGVPQGGLATTPRALHALAHRPA